MTSCDSDYSFLTGVSGWATHRNGVKVALLEFYRHMGAGMKTTGWDGTQFPFPIGNHAFSTTGMAKLLNCVLPPGCPTDVRLADRLHALVASSEQAVPNFSTVVALHNMTTPETCSRLLRKLHHRMWLIVNMLGTIAWNCTTVARTTLHLPRDFDKQELGTVVRIAFTTRPELHNMAGSLVSLLQEWNDTFSQYVLN